MQSDNLNIIISAHELSPVQGSECAEGWNVIQNLIKNKKFNLFVLYAEGSQYSPLAYKKAIDSYYLEHEQNTNLNFIPVKQPKLTLMIAKINRLITREAGGVGFPILYYWGYSIWHKELYKTVKNLIAKQNIDIIHHLTQITFREPGYLWQLNIPFIWGPTGGISGISLKILKDLSVKQAMFELIRNISNYWQFHFKKRVKQALKKSDLIYTFSKEDLKIISRHNSNVKILLDAGTTPTKNAFIRNFNTSDKLKLIWAGQLIERKALIILIKALTKIANIRERMEVFILGDGPLKEDYVKEINKFQMEMCFHFVDQIPHDEVINYFNKAHVFLHTSYREATSHVVPEALSSGLPVICHDAFGLSIAVTDKCGIKIPLKSFNCSIDGFSAAIIKILNEPEIIYRLSEGALERAKELSWASMAENIANDYNLIYRKNENIIN